MTSFKISNDDFAVRALQENNKTPVISGPVTPVKASNPVPKSPEYLSLQSSNTERRHSEPYQSQRRQSDRRNADSRVLLDTRSQHNRRTALDRRNGDEEKKLISISRGIDEVI